MIKRSFDTTKRSGGRLPTSFPSQAEGPPPIVFGPSPEWRSRSVANPQQTATAPSPLNPGPRPTRSFQGILRSPLGPRNGWQSRSTANPRQTTTTAPSGSAESVGHLGRPTAPHFHGIRLAPPPPIVLGPCSERQSRSTANRQRTTTVPSGSAKSIGSLRILIGLAPSLWSQDVH